MTKRMMLLALLALAVTTIPAFAADDAAPGMNAPGMHEPGMHADQHLMHQDPEMMRQMMQNPQLLLAMAYHKNLVTFALALKKVAQRGETVPRDFARAAITEMRRSADQMDIHHEEAARNLPAEMKAKHAEMAKKMAAHLSEMRGELAQLEELSKGDRIASKELLKHLQILLKGCHDMCGESGMCHHGTSGEAGPCKEGHGKGMDCGCGRGGKMHAPGSEEWGVVMQERQKMMQNMKAQDAEIAKLVDKMNQAPHDQKQAVMADILTRMVKQRAEMNAYMERTQEQMRQHHHGEGGAMQPCSMHRRDGAAENSEDVDAYEGDSEMDSGDMDSDDAGSESDHMNMKDMNMKDMNMKDMNMKE